VTVSPVSWFFTLVYEKEKAMLRRNMRQISLVTFFAILELIGPAPTGAAQFEYSGERLFVIPWGDGSGCLCTSWLSDPGVYHMLPGPWAVSYSGELVIYDFCDGSRRLMKYSRNGDLVGSVDLAGAVNTVEGIAISNTGHVLLSNSIPDPDSHTYITELLLFNPALELIGRTGLPNAGTDCFTCGIFPSESDSFWILFRSKMEMENGSWQHERRLVEYSVDRGLSTSVLLYSGENSDPGAMQARFVTPSGQTRSEIEDMYGFTYDSLPEDPNATIGRFSPEGELVYTHQLVPGSGFERFRGFSYYFITWSGDFYTLRATDEGAVLTKYTLVVE